MLKISTKSRINSFIGKLAKMGLGALARKLRTFIKISETVSPNAVIYYEDGTFTKGYEDKTKIKDRQSGPAHEDEYQSAWYVNNLLHREDGPAFELKSDPSENAWFIKGKELSEQSFEAIRRTNSPQRLAIYLTSNIPAERYFAEIRMKELNNGK